MGMAATLLLLLLVTIRLGVSGIDGTVLHRCHAGGKGC